MNISKLKYHKMKRPCQTKSEARAALFNALLDAVAQGYAEIVFAYANCPDCQAALRAVYHRAYPRPLFLFCAECPWVDLSRIPKLNLAPYQTEDAAIVPRPQSPDRPLDRAIRSYFRSLSIPFPDKP